MKKPLIPIILLLVAWAMINGGATRHSSSPSISPDKNSEDSAVVCGTEGVAINSSDAAKPGCSGNRSTYLLNNKKNK